MVGSAIRNYRYPDNKGDKRKGEGRKDSWINGEKSWKPPACQNAGLHAGRQGSLKGEDWEEWNVNA